MSDLDLLGMSAEPWCPRCGKDRHGHCDAPLLVIPVRDEAHLLELYGLDRPPWETEENQ